MRSFSSDRPPFGGGYPFPFIGLLIIILLKLCIVNLINYSTELGWCAANLLFYWLMRLVTVNSIISYSVQPSGNDGLLKGKEAMVDDWWYWRR